MSFGYITKLSSTVKRQSVQFHNRYGMNLAGDLYYAKDMDKTQTSPALIVGAPYGGVKEQGPAVYANQLAQRGFIVLTFDQVFMGESAGEPKGMYVIDDCEHIDLYDRVDKIPFAKIQQFFKKVFK